MLAGSTFKVEGATPKLQVHMAPLTTSGGISTSRIRSISESPARLIASLRRED
jgi:hypothetical protein